MIDSCGQHDIKFGELVFSGVDPYFTSVSLYDVIAEAQTQTGSLACWFCGKKKLKNFVNDRFGNSVSVISYFYLGFVINPFCAYRNCWKITFAKLIFFLIDRIKSIIENIKKNPPYVLRNNIYFSQGFIKVCLHGRVEGFIFCS